MPTPKFEKLAQRNDWGHIFYTYAKEGLSAFGTNDRSKSLDIKAGSKIEVQWPDKTTSKEMVLAEAETSVIGDMGQTYTVKTTRLYVETKVRGLKVKVYLEDLKLPAGIPYLK